MRILFLCGFLALADQVVKYLVRTQLALNASVPIVDGCFNLTHVRNPGAAWGMLGGFNTWLTLLSFVMLVLLVVFRRTFVGGVSMNRWALGCMLGGIAGNLFDRIRLTFVVDYLDFHWGVHHFPSFNIADAAICTGVGLYILASFLPLQRGTPALSNVPDRCP